MVRLIYYCGLLLLVCSCGNRSQDPGAKASPDMVPGWIAGEWKSGDGPEIYLEHWRKLNDTLFSGYGCMLRGSDTLFSETMEIRMVNDTLCYIPLVSGQNDGNPVLFRLKERSDDKLVFHNLQHDFPQQITYVFRYPDSLHAWIDGTDRGVYRREDFRMRRADR